MAAASNRVVLLIIADAAAIYIWRKSPHGALAAVLFAASIGIADLVSVRVVKPAVARVRPCAAEPQRVKHPLGCGSGASFPSAHAADTAAAAVGLSWAGPRPRAGCAVLGVIVGISRGSPDVRWPNGQFGAEGRGAALATAATLAA